MRRNVTYGGKFMENHETQSNPVRGAFASAEELASCASDGRSRARGAVRRFFVWTFLTAKRLLKKPSFVLILLMLPAARRPSRKILQKGRLILTFHRNPGKLQRTSRRKQAELPPQAKWLQKWNLLRMLDLA